MVNVINKRFFLPVLFSTLLLFGYGCGTTTVKTKEQLRSLVSARNYPRALELVKSDKYYPEERSRLLKYLEEGIIHYLLGDNYQSLKILEQAQALSDRLFTVSISKRALTFVSSNKSDNYYGDRYERSLIRYYLALNHYLLAQKALNRNQKQVHLSAARAIILEWDTLLDSYRADLMGDSVYKVDLSAKVFGAFIHEQIGSRSDLQIALQLYKDAKKVLFQNYNSYPAFNSKSKEFKKDYSKLPDMDRSAVERNYVSTTAHAKTLIQYLDGNIKRLESKKGRHNLSVVIENGFIATKRPRKIDFPIPINMLPSLGVQGGLTPLEFSLKILSMSRGLTPRITFELPEVKITSTRHRMKLVVKSTVGKTIKEQELALLNPLSEIAYEALDARIAGIYAKLGARLALKHATALVSAYASYRTAIKAGTPKFMAFFIGQGIYIAASKGIAMSEQADLRQWSVLPHDLRMGSLSLPEGDYVLFLEKTGPDGGKQVTRLGNITVKDRQSASLVNYRI